MHRIIVRPGWARAGVLLALVAGSGAAGFYLAGSGPGPGRPDRSEIQQPVPVTQAPSPARHRFALTPADAKDTIEAPALATDLTGRLFLAWASRTGANERTLFLTRSTDGGISFGEPQVVSTAGVYRSGSRASGKSSGYERRATPHLAVAGDQLLLSWSEATPDASGMRLVLAAFADGGATFRTPRPVHHAQTPNPTFTDMTVGTGPTVACTWLGDSAGCQQPYAAIQSVGTEEFAPEQRVTAGGDGKGVCPCCPTAACFAPDGTLYVAYRNIQDGYRDIAIGRLRPGQAAFEGPFPVASGVWKFDGCPHDGPSLAVVEGELHVAWMDAHTGRPRCYHGWARLPEMTFATAELHAAGPGSQGNARLCADGAGGLHAVWEESLGAETPDAQGAHQHGPPKVGTGGGRVVQYAYRGSGDKQFGAACAVAPKPGAFQTRPALALGKVGAVWVAWNELDVSGKAVVVARLAVPTLVAARGRP